MEAVRSLETKVAEVHKDLPHLPAGARAWLVANAWWIVLIGVILGAMGFLSALSLLMTLSSMGGIYAGLPYASYVAQSTIWLWISLILGVVSLVLEAMAIGPLKSQLRRGWRLIFLASLVNLVSGIIGVLFGNFFGLIGVALGVAIGWYFLFEVRDGFDGKTVSSTPAAPAGGAKKDI
jgi:hypothetical protein